MVERYPDADPIKLSQLIPPGYLRTVPRGLLDVSAGISERSIVIEMGRDFAAGLNVKVPMFRRLHGFVRMNDTLKEYDGIDHKTGKYGKQIQNICLSEWEDRFILVIELTNGREKGFYVTKEEVQQLLSTCQLAPEHRL